MARFGFKDEDLKLWALVTATVKPREPRRAVTAKAPAMETVRTEMVKIGDLPPMIAEKPTPPPLTPFRLGQALRPQSGYRLVHGGDGDAPDPIEPRRKRRLSRERDPIEARLDLHGLNSIAAEARLKAFVQQAYANDYRSVLVITGKGIADTGVLKRHAPEWLSDPALGHIVAGVSTAHARHGGTGALYVALKRRA